LWITNVVFNGETCHDLPVHLLRLLPRCGRVAWLLWRVHRGGCLHWLLLLAHVLRIGVRRHLVSLLHGLLHGLLLHGLLLHGHLGLLYLIMHRHLRMGLLWRDHHHTHRLLLRLGGALARRYTTQTILIRILLHTATQTIAGSVLGGLTCTDKLAHYLVNVWCEARHRYRDLK